MSGYFRFVFAVALIPVILVTSSASSDSGVINARPASKLHPLLVRGADSVHIHQVIEEMIDDLTEDVRRLNPAKVSPMAFESLVLTPNLSADFGLYVEGVIVAALAGQTEHVVKRCVACKALHTRVEDSVWVVRMGMVRQEDMIYQAQRLGVVTFLRTALSWFPRANVVALQAEIVKASDGAVLWSDVYRSDATTAAILRSGNRIQTREERILELERKIAGRPYFGYRIWGGFTAIPYDASTPYLSGLSAGIQIFERFGSENRWTYGVSVDGFIRMAEFNSLLGSFALGTLQYEVFPPNLNAIEVRTGPALGGFSAGSEPNTIVAEWTVDVNLKQRLGAGASLVYFRPVEYLGRDLGGLAWKARITGNW